MAELKPCPRCGEIPRIKLTLIDIPEAETLYPGAILRCKCRALKVVALTEEKAVEFAEEKWNEVADNV